LPNKNLSRDDSFATALTEVSDRLTRLVQDEIELAKTEVAQKASSLARGAAAVAAGAVFGIFAVIFFLLTLAWVLDGIFVTGAGSLWLGFLIVLIILLALTVGSFLFAWNKLKVGPPTPKMAISEGKKIKNTVTAFGSDSTNGHSVVTPESIAAAISPAIAAATPTPAPAPTPPPRPAPLVATGEPATIASAPASPDPATAAPVRPVSRLTPAEPAPPATSPESDPEAAATGSLWTESAPSEDPPTFVSIPEPSAPAPAASAPTGEAPSVAGEETQYDVEPAPEPAPDSDRSSTGPEN
jgi:hypothetical protein